MDVLAETLQLFFSMLLKLTVLFLSISTLTALLLTWIPHEKIKIWMTGKGVFGNIIGTGAGAMTPFCACSTIPLTLGFLQAGIPFGSVMSFLIASPLLNPLILGIITVFIGGNAALWYFLIVFPASVAFGILAERLGGAAFVKRVRIPSKIHQDEDLRNTPFYSQLSASFKKAFRDFRNVFPFLLIGVAAGAGIYGYVPDDLVMRFAGPGSRFAVPAAAIIGVPLYVRAETAIPIAAVLMQKGMTSGAAAALIIGGAGMALPEMSLLAGIFRKRLVAAVIAGIFCTAVIGGFIFNMIV